MAFSVGYNTTPYTWSITGQSPIQGATGINSTNQSNTYYWENYLNTVQTLNKDRMKATVPNVGYETTPTPWSQAQTAVTNVLPQMGQNIQSFDYETLGSSRTRTIKAGGIEDVSDTTGAEKLAKAEQLSKISSVSDIGSSVFKMLDARQNYVNVKKMKSQYEAQKKIIDANIANQEALMMDNYDERMASADALYAAKNVDISSGALTGLKQQGAMEMGKDFRAMEAQANINKLALDLDYAMKKRQAKTEEWNTYVSEAFNIGMNAASLYAGGI